ncbi:MAG: hypothetical protein ABSF71_04125, partial [Terriglobia bacterium]
MAQDYSASWDLPDFPGWRGDQSNGDTDGLRTASAKVWPRISAFARKELANKVSAEERKALTLEAWGDTLVSVAETLKRHRGKDTIRDLEGFLFGTFQHRMNRLLILARFQDETKNDTIAACQDHDTSIGNSSRKREPSLPKPP